MPLDLDIIERIHTDFANPEAAIAHLRSSGKVGRIARCIVFAANGSIDKLQELIQIAKTDYRDVIVAGEYDATRGRVRDLSVSFLIASPSDFWISGIAKSIYERGYYLIAINSRPAHSGPFDDTCDRSEGTAKFSNGVHQIEIEKADRKWSVAAPDNLRRFGLDEPIGDEERFNTQLDFYLSQK